MNLISHVAAKLKIYKKFVVYKKVSGRTPASRSPPPAPRVPEKKVAHRIFTVRDSSRRGPAPGGAGMRLRPRGSPCQNEFLSLPEAGAALLPPLGDTPRDQNSAIPSGSSSTPGAVPILAPGRVPFPSQRAGAATPAGRGGQGAGFGCCCCGTGREGTGGWPGAGVRLRGPPEPHTWPESSAQSSPGLRVPWLECIEKCPSDPPAWPWGPHTNPGVKGMPEWRLCPGVDRGRGRASPEEPPHAGTQSPHGPCPDPL